MTSIDYSVVVISTPPQLHGMFDDAMLLHAAFSLGFVCAEEALERSHFAAFVGLVEFERPHGRVGSCAVLAEYR